MLFINLTRLCSSSKARFSSALRPCSKLITFEVKTALETSGGHPSLSLSSLALICSFNDYHILSLAALRSGITVANFTTPKQLIPLIAAAGHNTNCTAWGQFHVRWFQELLYPLISTVVTNRVWVVRRVVVLVIIWISEPIEAEIGEVPIKVRKRRPRKSRSRPRKPRSPKWP